MTYGESNGHLTVTDDVSCNSRYLLDT